MAITNIVLTKTIGDEIVAILKTAVATRLDAAKVISFGEPQRLASVDAFEDLIPGVFVKPEEAAYEALDVSGTEYRVRELYRICYAFSTVDVAVDVYGEAMEALDEIGERLSSNPRLSGIASAISPHQIEDGSPDIAEYQPLEDLFLADQGVQIKVVCLRWRVTWLARRSS